MILQKLTLRNFGPYKGQQEFELKTTKSKNLVLIGALNGAGKTTFLDALHLVLYGKRASLSNRKGKPWEKYLAACIHRTAPASEGASVELGFDLTVNGERKSFVVNRHWKQNGDSVKDGLAVYVDGDLDTAWTENWNEAVEGFFPQAISPLFLFDGEKIESLADPDSAREILRTALWALLGLDLVDRLKADLGHFARMQKVQGLGEEERARSQKMQDEIIRLEAARNGLVEKRAALQSALDQADQNRIKAEKSFQAEGGTLFERRNELGVEHEKLRARLETIEQGLRQEAAGAMPLLLVRDALEQLAEAVSTESGSGKLESVLALIEKAHQKLLRELADEGLDKAVLSRIKEKLKGHVDGLRSNSAKREHTFGLSNTSESLLAQLMAEIGNGSAQEKARTAVKRWEECSREVSEVNRKINAVPAEESIAGQRDALMEARKEHLICEARVRHIDEEIQKTSLELAKAMKEHERFADKHSAQMQAAEEQRRVLEYREKVQSVLEAFEDRVLRKHLERIEAEILKRFKTLMRKDTLVQRIAIDPATFTTRLFDRRDAELEPDRLSAGERQLFAVAVLWGLAKVSGRTLPTVVDTPMGRLDSVHREKLVTKYYPSAASQVILLSQDEEIDADIYPLLQEHVSQEYALRHDDDAEQTKVSIGYPFKKRGRG